MFASLTTPYDTREIPAPIPSAGIFDSPTVVLCVNVEWVSHLDGLLERLLWADAWIGTDEEIEDAIQEVHKLLVALLPVSDCP